MGECVDGLGGSGHTLAFPSANSIMLSNEVFALACRAYYDEIGLIVDETNGEFAHSPLTRQECNTGYYLLHGDHQHQGLLQSRDLDKCCFFIGDAKKWLYSSDHFPNDFFELCSIYEKYSREHCKKASEVNHSEKDELGRSKNAVKAALAGNAEKDSSGKSLSGVRRGKKSAAKLMKLGVGVTARTPEKMSVDGRKAGKIGGRKTSSQVWESTVDGYRSNAGAVATHNRSRGWDPNARVRVG